ncbi:hypothetical protein RB195_016905 [Necator americanus]|uniref:Uncharacterized protein n=1 Tax=Necator americanus TaxID=51031 RepID=A0ABR1C5U0_NECAM
MQNTPTIEQKPKKITFDKLLEQHLGSFGRYQISQIILVCSPTTLLALHVMSWTFVGLSSEVKKTPNNKNAECRLLNTDRRWEYCSGKSPTLIFKSSRRLRVVRRDGKFPLIWASCWRLVKAI